MKNSLKSGKNAMFAVIDVAGQQLKVSPSEKVFIPKTSGEIGAILTFDQVLLVADGKDVKIGNPTLPGMSVTAKVLAHMKDDKVIVFKKKRRKGYRLRRGHRQQFTQVEITNIS